MTIGIVGAGATGLAAGYALAKAGHTVTVFEKHGLGGLARAQTVGETRVEAFYHHIFTNDAEIIRTLGEVGLEGRLQWAEPVNALYLGGRLHPFTTPGDLLRFGPLAPLGRLRTGLAVLAAKYVKDFRAMEDVSAKDWLVAKTGRQAYETLWKPLLNAKFGEDADRVSGVWIWNKFKLRGSTRSNLNSESLGYVQGSFLCLYEALGEEILRRGGRLVQETVTGFRQGGLTTDAGVYAFDKMVFTGAPEELAGLAPFASPYRQRLARVAHKANLCVTCLVKRPVSDYYWVTVAEPDAPFVLFIEHTNLVRDPGYGCGIVYLSRYLSPEDPLFAAPDRDVAALFLAYAQKMFPAFTPDVLLETRVARARYAQPVITKRYSEALPPFETPVPGLYLAGMAQIYPEDRGQNYALALGKKIAGIITEEEVS